MSDKTYHLLSRNDRCSSFPALLVLWQVGEGREFIGLKRIKKVFTLEWLVGACISLCKKRLCKFKYLETKCYRNNYKKIKLFSKIE